MAFAQENSRSTPISSFKVYPRKADHFPIADHPPANPAVLDLRPEMIAKMEATVYSNTSSSADRGHRYSLQERPAN
jgi:hypothetical protein